MWVVENAERKVCPSVNTLSEYTDKINNAIYDIKKSYVYIGGLLNEINSFETYKELGFENIAEYCEQAFGFKKTFTYDLMNVQRKFNNGTIFNLDERYKNYDFSKLVVMSRMNDFQLVKCNPEMTVQELKVLKKLNHMVSDSARAENSEKLKVSVVNTSERQFEYQNNFHITLVNAYQVDFFKSFFGLDCQVGDKFHFYGDKVN